MNYYKQVSDTFLLTLLKGTCFAACGLAFMLGLRFPAMLGAEIMDLSLGLALVMALCFSLVAIRAIAVEIARRLALQQAVPGDGPASRARA